MKQIANLGFDSVRQAVLLLAVLLALVLLLSGCSDVMQLFGKAEKQSAQPLEVTKFTYSVSGMCEGYTATFEAVPGGTHVVMDIAYGTYHMDEVLEEDYMSMLSQLATEQRMDKWDGFDKINKRVLDGESFSLEIVLADGRIINASGSNAYPKNYNMSEVEALIDELARTYSDMYPKQIQSDDLHYFSITFRGEPYATSEFVLSSLSKDDAEQLEIRIRDREDLIDGLYEFNGIFDHFPYDRVQEIIRKYDVPSWNGWNLSGEEEQFSLMATYESSELLEARGKAHPENYDAFRDDITALLMEYIEENRDAFQPYAE